MSYRNLLLMYQQADETDITEGKNAYNNYNKVMKDFSEYYGVSLNKVTAAFVALSPNNSYPKNIKSLASVLHGFVNNIPCEKIKVSTYNHCRDRAYSYLKNTIFDTPERGLKTLSFYHNILDPNNKNWVTVDGHIKATFVNKNLTMKEAIIKSKKEYFQIQDKIKIIADIEQLIPNQVQAIIWFTRKRTLGIDYKPQLSLFTKKEDKWGTIYKAEEVIPYANYK